MAELSHTKKAELESGSDQSLAVTKEGPSPMTSTEVSDIQPMTAQCESPQFGMEVPLSHMTTTEVPDCEIGHHQSLNVPSMTESELGLLHTEESEASPHGATIIAQGTMSENSHQRNELITGSQFYSWQSPAFETQHAEAVMSRLQMNIQTLMKDKIFLEKQLEEKQTEIDKLKVAHEVEKQIGKTIENSL